MTPRFLRMFAVRLCAVVALCLVSMLLILQSKVSPELPTESAPKAAPLKTLFKTTSLSRNALVAAPEYYLLSLSPSPENAQLMSATLKVAVEGCPTAKPALIGILTTAEVENTFRRQYLREQYRKQNEQLPEDQQIEIMFLLGREHSYEKRFQIQTEQSLHPTDTLITNRTENANEGKILDWFQYARSVLYTRHPTSPNQYCKRYAFVGKAEDDETINIAVLSRALSALTPSQANFVGYPVAVEESLKLHNKNLIKMHGMLYFINAEMVEWINFSDIPETYLVGPESHQVSKWLAKSGLRIETVNWRTKYHETTHVISFENQPISKETIVVHPCKTNVFFRCMEYMFDRVSIDHEYVTSMETAASHLERLSLTFPASVVHQSWLYMRELMKLRDPVAPTLSVPEFEYALLHYTLILHLSQELTCSLSDATISTLILHILNLNRIGGGGKQREFLKPTREATDLFLVSSIVDARMMHKGLSGADVSVEKMVEILEGFMLLKGDDDGKESLNKGAGATGATAGDELYLSLNSTTGVLDDAAIDLFLVSHAVIHGAIRLGISHEFERSDVVKKFATGLVELLGRNDGQEIMNQFVDLVLKERGVAFETNKSELFDGVKKAIVDVIEGDRKVLEVGELDQIVKTRFEADNSTL